MSLELSSGNYQQSTYSNMWVYLMFIVYVAQVLIKKIPELMENFMFTHEGRRKIFHLTQLYLKSSLDAKIFQLKLFTTKYFFIKQFSNFLPFLNWIPSYSLRHFRKGFSPSLFFIPLSSNLCQIYAERAFVA